MSIWLVHSCCFSASCMDCSVSILKYSHIMCVFNDDRSIIGRSSPVGFGRRTGGCRSQERWGSNPGAPRLPSQAAAEATLRSLSFSSDVGNRIGVGERFGGDEMEVHLKPLYPSFPEELHTAWQPRTPLQRRRGRTTTGARCNNTHHRNPRWPTS